MQPTLLPRYSIFSQMVGGSYIISVFFNSQNANLFLVLISAQKNIWPSFRPSFHKTFPVNLNRPISTLLYYRNHDYQSYNIGFKTSVSIEDLFRPVERQIIRELKSKHKAKRTPQKFRKYKRKNHKGAVAR